MNNSQEQSKLNKINGISDSEFETLVNVLIQAPNLRDADVRNLLEKELVFSEWSDYGYKLSDKGMLAIEDPF